VRTSITINAIDQNVVHDCYRNCEHVFFRPRSPIELSVLRYAPEVIKAQGPHFLIDPVANAYEVPCPWVACPVLRSIDSHWRKQSFTIDFHCDPNLGYSVGF